jgi:hypothetical protein
MTGKANGFCLIHIPDEPGEPRTGFAGLAGEPVAMGLDFRKMDGRSLQGRLREMQAELAAMRCRLDELESGGRAGTPRRPGPSGTRGKQ